VHAHRGAVLFHRTLLELHIDSTPVLFKQEYLFPTGSYKDRGASVLISKAKELGILHVLQDSSGNAGTAIAAYRFRAHRAWFENRRQNTLPAFAPANRAQPSIVS